MRTPALPESHFRVGFCVMQKQVLSRILGIVIVSFSAARVGDKKAARVTETELPWFILCPFEDARGRLSWHLGLLSPRMLRRDVTGGEPCLHGSLSAVTHLPPVRRLLCVEWLVGSPVCGVHALVHPKHSYFVGKKHLTWEGYGWRVVGPVHAGPGTFSCACFSFALCSRAGGGREACREPLPFFPRSFFRVSCVLSKLTSGMLDSWVLVC